MPPSPKSSKKSKQKNIKNESSTAYLLGIVFVAIVATVFAIAVFFTYFGNNKTQTQTQQSPQTSSSSAETTQTVPKKQIDKKARAGKVVSIGPNVYKELTQDPNKDVFVKFFFPSCEACKVMDEAWKTLAEESEDLPSVIIAEYNIRNSYEAYSLAVELKIASLPTMLYYPKNNKEPITFPYTRELDNFKKFMNKHSGEKLYEVNDNDAIDTADPDEESNVKAVAPETFDSIVNDPTKNVLLEFYAPWCSACMSLKPKLAEFAKRVSTEAPNDLIIAATDVTKHVEYMSTYNITGYPTFVFFSKADKKGIKYEGDLDIDALVSFINKKAGAPLLKEQVSIVRALTSSDFDEVVNDPKKNVLVEFYAPWCGACKALQPIYEKLAEDAQKTDEVVITKVDAIAQPELANRFSITSFPTLWLFSTHNKAGEKFDTTNRPRDLNGLKGFINELAGKTVLP